MKRPLAYVYLIRQNSRFRFDFSDKGPTNSAATDYRLSNAYIDTLVLSNHCAVDFECKQFHSSETFIS